MARRKQPSRRTAGSIATQRFKHVAVVGAGVIGSSWTALFLAHGLRVTVYDPRPDVEDMVRNTLRQAAPALKALGLPTVNLTRHLKFAHELEDAVDGADVVQESATEDLGLKQHLFARISRIAGLKTLLLSSSSGFPATDISKDMATPGRMLIGHPYNPPHLLPLVEVVPGERTDPAAVADAVAFYKALGKTPLVLRKEVPGFVINRLQAAFFRECVHLVREGVVTVEELDMIVTNSMGIRWAAAGPFLSFHAGGGPGGLQHFLEHIGPAFERLWKVLGEPKFDPPMVGLLSAQAKRAFGKISYEDLQRARDRKQLAIMQALRRN
ncbi:MAG TPA: 3-hydroxyacyl-CoA dehydrogenase NAD-binding domain-containing protein [Terriglobales bacterium]|nr:3-hydroxyacyl-CoA dehydrogenase NAD-binding domain-containing protein [Terriglobales bacterium]